jgi:hypothetical protein
MSRFTVLLIASFLVASPSLGQSPCDTVPASIKCTLLDDFESYSPGEPPFKWRTTTNDNLIPLTAGNAMSPAHNFYVRKENDNQFVQGFTRDKSIRLVLSRKTTLRWNVTDKPYLRWRWRAQTLPEGANEKDSDKNDTGGAVYVTFEKNWLGLPKSIKYTYSSALEPGTTVDYGNLKVLVVASKPNQGTGAWISHERNVAEDYKRLFGDKPDKTPLAVMLWNDSNTMNSRARVDFDDIMVLSGPSLERKAASSR